MPLGPKMAPQGSQRLIKKLFSYHLAKLLSPLLLLLLLILLLLLLLFTLINNYYYYYYYY